MAKATIKRGFIRGIQTKKFEQFTIIAEETDEFEYSSKEERDAREKVFTEEVLGNFVKAYNLACDTLGVDRCIATVEGEKPSRDKDIIKKPELNESDSDFDFFEED